MGLYPLGPAGLRDGTRPAPDPRRGQTAAADPIVDTARSGTFAGLLAIDLASRRRMRVNGRLQPSTDGEIVIEVDQAYANCPKYIQRRAVDEGGSADPPRLAGRSRSLDEDQRGWIRRADTFFIASLNPGEGADASHRGGMPGFVAVEGDRLVWPDYGGNLMYNTLGNIAAHPYAGLVFPEFASGRVLMLTGRAAIDWDPARAAAVPGAERLVELSVDEVVEIGGVLPPSLRVLDYSPFNPPAGPAIPRGS